MYTINGVSATTTTDALGRYSIIAPRGSQVIITPQVGLGVTVTPPSLSLPACENRDDLNFVLTPVTIP